MEKFFEGYKSNVINYKLESCCLVAPLRTGLLAIGYFNVLMSVVLIVGTATESFVPIIARVQELVSGDAGASTATCILAPTAELAAGVLLLAATHRRDAALLRVYVWYGLGAVAVTVLVYAVVIAAISALYVVCIVASAVYQVYVIFLVRSLLLEIKLQDSSNKNGTVPSATYTQIDPETPNEPATSELGAEAKMKEDNNPIVEIVDEAPKLKAIEVIPKTSETAAKATTSRSGAALKVTVTSVAAGTGAGAAAGAGAGAGAAPGARAATTTPRVIFTTAKESTISPIKESTSVKEADTAEEVLGTDVKDDDVITKDTSTDTGGTGAAAVKTVKSRRRFWK